MSLHAKQTTKAYEVIVGNIAKANESLENVFDTIKAHKEKLHALEKPAVVVAEDIEAHIKERDETRKQINMTIEALETAKTAFIEKRNNEINTLSLYIVPDVCIPVYNIIILAKESRGYGQSELDIFWAFADDDGTPHRKLRTLKLAETKDA